MNMVTMANFHAWEGLFSLPFIDTLTRWICRFRFQDGKNEVVHDFVEFYLKSKDCKIFF